jgi:hypothetical protein
MIDWVMPPQTVVALYIYRVGRSCPARNPFTTRNSQGLLNSTRTRGPPVRPVRPTGQTGVAVAGSATRRPTGQTVKGHWSDFFSKACCLKNNSKVDVTLHRPFFGLRAIFTLNCPYPINHLARH